MVARIGSRSGLPVAMVRAAPATATVEPGVRLPRPGRLITLAAPRRIRKSGVISATRLNEGRVSS
ncbi:hypothetical protein D3C81_2103990 [compost metagenome]